MNFTVKRKVAKTVHTGSLVELYPHDLQLYRIPPIHPINLQEFEGLAVERLKVFRILATVTTLKGFKIYSHEWINAVIEQLKKEGLKSYARSCHLSGFTTTDADLQARRNDHISHFILRLAYCRSEELRKWFTQREIELFKMRFQSLTAEGVTNFFKVNNLQYVPITHDEKFSVVEHLYESTSGCSHGEIESLNFYKVKFSDVFDLVRIRKVFLKDGCAYIPSTEFVSVLSSQFRSHINQSLAVANRKLPEIEHDERIVSLLKGLHNSYTGADYNTSSKTGLPIENLDALSGKSYPLCMRQLHDHLRSTHHMKHGGRIQYGLFLKAAGVSLEDSMRFWREEFTKIMDLEKFEKSYSYNVRYNYGKEGSKKNYSPYSCMKIIQGSIGPGDMHGCPFRHSDASILKNKLLGYAINPSDISSIVDLVKKGHYQIACSKYFDVSHNVQMELGINHPNQYLEESQNVLSGIAIPNVENIKKERGYTYLNSQNDSIKKDPDNKWDGSFENQDIEMEITNAELDIS